jgi:adenine-specific DNA-methyltransferase
MRFIGNKTKLLVYIHEILRKHDALPGHTFFDFFAGTASVGKYFKEKGYLVSSSDILYFSFVLQEAYIGTTREPLFKQLLEKLPKAASGAGYTGYELTLRYLNSVPGVEGFIYQNYTEEGTANFDTTRKFFKGENGKKIDAIRILIEEWYRKQWVSREEYYVLLATLIESVPFYANISGVYAAFLKDYDPRAKKDFVLRPIKLTNMGPTGRAYNRNSMEMLKDINTDILYLDPPYNARQYAPNYHVLETIARYDNPKIKGVAGIRPYETQKSEFCNVQTALAALDTIANTATYKVLALSYNSEGIMPAKEILKILSKYGDTHKYEVDYRRFKSNSGGALQRKTVPVKEQLYVLKKTS